MLKAMMTADQLKIEEWEKEALIWLRDQLIEGKIKHFEVEGKWDAPLEGKILNMVLIHSRRDCGTICCIGGWMGLHEGMDDIKNYVSRHERLNELFYPEADDYDSITGKEVIATINHFLYTGEIVWGL